MHPIINLSGKQKQRLKRRPSPSRKDLWERFSRRHQVNRIQFPQRWDLPSWDVGTEGQVSAANCRLGARPGVGSRAGELSGLLQPQNSAAISEAGTCFRCGFPPASPCIASALVELILPPGCAHRSFPHAEPQLSITSFCSRVIHTLRGRE